MPSELRSHQLVSFAHISFADSAVRLFRYVFAHSAPPVRGRSAPEGRGQSPHPLRCPHLRLHPFPNGTGIALCIVHWKHEGKPSTFNLLLLDLSQSGHGPSSMYLFNDFFAQTTPFRRPSGVSGKNLFSTICRSPPTGREVHKCTFSS